MRSALSELPTDRVICLEGPTVEQFAVAIDPLPENAPVIVMLEIGAAADAAGAVGIVLDALESVARAQLTAWLPAAVAVTASSDAERRTIRRLARETASSTSLYGPYLADLAEAALRRQPRVHRHDADTRAAALSGILARTYGRAAVTLAWWAAAALPPVARQVLGTAAHWFTGRGFGIWILGAGVVEPGRFPTVTLTAAPPADAASPALTFPVLAGRPHPGSAVELDVEARLQRHAWARGRTWNQIYHPHPLTPPIRVDLMWPAERVVVELDGPDHRGIVKYADDRRRDNALTVGGYAVLRFTNAEVTTDASRVLAMIEGLLAARREGGTPGEDRAR